MNDLATQTQQESFYAGFSSGAWVESHLKDRGGMSPRRLAVEFQCTYLTQQTLQGVNRVLDAGCGGGFLADYLATSPRPIRYVGCDISLPVLDAARRRAPSRQFFYGDMRFLPFATDAFDLSYSRDAVIHHVKPFEAVAELYRVAPSLLLRIRTADIPTLFTAYYRKSKLLHQFFPLGEMLQFLRSLRPAPARIRYKVHERYPRRYEPETFTNHGGFQSYFVTDLLVAKGAGEASALQIKDDTERSLMRRALRRIGTRRG